MKDYSELTEIIVKSQAELDDIPVDFKGRIYIEFGTIYTRAGEKVAGVLRWTKKVSRCVIGKKRKRDRKKVKRAIGRKRSLLEKKEMR